MDWTLLLGVMRLEWEDMKLSIIRGLSLYFRHRIIGTLSFCLIPPLFVNVLVPGSWLTYRSDSTGNLGAWINLKKDLKLQFETFEAVPHPNIKPMAYASNLIGSMM